MSPFMIDLEKTKTQTSLVNLEPGLNAFGSMLLLSAHEDEPGIHEWIAKTRARMTAEERARHKLVLIGLHYAVLPRQGGLTFEAYLDELEASSPSELRERLLDAYSKICMTNESQKEIGQPVNWDEVLASPTQYVDFLRYRFGEELTDEVMEAQAYQYVIDPVAMKQLVTGHMRWFW